MILQVNHKILMSKEQKATPSAKGKHKQDTKFKAAALQSPKTGTKS